MLTAMVLFAGQAMAQSTEKVYEPPTEHVEYKIPPSFPGGSDSLNAFLRKHIIYREAFTEIAGKVYVQITIDSTGAIHNPVIRRSPHPSLSEEVLRIVALMPNWQPATLYGRPVTTKYVLPVKFQMH